MDNFYDLLSQNIRRPGIDSLINWLRSVEFEKCPASTKYHGAYEGGLVEHSINVFERLKLLATFMNGVPSYPMETLAIAALLHDVCKFDCYKKSGDGYEFNRQHLPLGHGEKSIFLIQQHMKLTYNEMIAIRWHMGGWDSAAKGGDQDYGAAQSVPLALLLHTADMLASRIDEGEVASYDQRS